MKSSTEDGHHDRSFYEEINETSKPTRMDLTEQLKIVAT